MAEILNQKYDFETESVFHVEDHVKIRSDGLRVILSNASENTEREYLLFSAITC